MSDVYVICGAIGLSILCFRLGKMEKEVAILKELSSVSFFGAFWACIEANGLKNATVIRSIIEKYNPPSANQGKTDLAQKMVEELEKATFGEFPGISGDDKTRTRKPGFDDGDDLDPNDLV
jgi:hypothetical protein